MRGRSPVINVMERAVRKAARGLVHDFGEVEHLQVSVKGPADFVSSADLRSERTLREELAKARPAFGFLMEESGAQTRIADPVRGPSVGRFETARDFVFALCAGFKARESIGDAVFDALQITGFEMQAVKVAVRTPVPAVQRVATSKANRHGHHCLLPHGANDDHGFRHGPRDGFKETRGQIMLVTVTRKRQRRRRMRLIMPRLAAGALISSMSLTSLAPPRRRSSTSLRL